MSSNSLVHNTSRAPRQRPTIWTRPPPHQQPLAPAAPGVADKFAWTIPGALLRRRRPRAASAAPCQPRRGPAPPAAAQPGWPPAATPAHRPRHRQAPRPAPPSRGQAHSRPAAQAPRAAYAASRRELPALGLVRQRRRNHPIDLHSFMRRARAGRRTPAQGSVHSRALQAMSATRADLDHRARQPR